MLLYILEIWKQISKRNNQFYIYFTPKLLHRTSNELLYVELDAIER